MKVWNVMTQIPRELKPARSQSFSVDDEKLQTKHRIFSEMKYDDGEGDIF